MHNENESQIEVQERLGYIWIILPENLNVATLGALEKTILSQLTGTADQVVLDLSRVQALYSSALGVLIRVRKQVGEEGGVVCLVNVNTSLVTMLESLNLNKVFPVYATDVEFEISEDRAWERRLSEQSIEFLFMAQVENGIYRISLSGDMVSGHDLSACRSFVPDRQVKVFIVDFVNLVTMDSSGAGVLIDLLHLIKAQNGEVRVFGVNKIVRQIMGFLGIDSRLALYKTEKEALKGTLEKNT